MAKVELITTCVGRASFLKETLPHNKLKVDNVVVVTTPTDYETQKICREEEVECVETDLFYRYNAPFDKGRAMNEGVSKLAHNDWVLFSDCDVLLLPAHKDFFRNKDLDKENLYGCRRIIIEGRAQYMDFIKAIAFNPTTLNINSLVNDDDKEVGVGFFQFFNMKSKVIEGVLGREIYLDNKTYKALIDTYVKDEAYPKIIKYQGQIHPCFPTAGGSDSQFRHFFIEQNLMVGLNIPVIHLGVVGSGHKGKSRNFE